MSRMELIELNHKLILGIARANGVNKISIFGSVARGEDHEGSDIDFLVEFEEGRTLFDLIRLKHELEHLLGDSVDIVTENSVHWTLKDQITSEAVQL